MGYSRRDGVAVDSARAGGKFYISRTAAVNLFSSPDSVKVKTSFEIARNNLIGSIPEILTTTIANIERQTDEKVEARALQLLRFFVQETRHIGQSLTDFFARDHSRDPSNNILLKEDPKAGAVLAYSGSLNIDEVLFLIDMLVERRAIRFDRGGLSCEITVMPAGFEQIAAASAEPDLEQAFVAMWFDESMRDAYDIGIETAVRATGYRALRIDRKEHVNKIDDEIIAEIRRSRFLIADFTSSPGSPRGGVYFEAGYALALGKPVIWTCRSDLIDHVHFDTRQFNHIVWTDPTELAERLTNRIGAVIGQGPLRAA